MDVRSILHHISRRHESTQATKLNTTLQNRPSVRQCWFEKRSCLLHWKFGPNSCWTVRQHVTYVDEKMSGTNDICQFLEHVHPRRSDGGACNKILFNSFESNAAIWSTTQGKECCCCCCCRIVWGRDGQSCIRIHEEAPKKQKHRRHAPSALDKETRNRRSHRLKNASPVFDNWMADHWSPQVFLDRTFGVSWTSKQLGRLTQSSRKRV